MLELDNGTGGVENKSSKSTDWSVWDGSGGDLDEISRKRTNGSWTCSLFDVDRDDDDDDEEEFSSRCCSCICSDIDGVDIDEAIDDERFSRSGESKLQKKKHSSFEFDRFYQREKCNIILIIFW